MKPGEFTRWRRALLAYYPEDIRRKKIASLCITGRPRPASTTTRARCSGGTASRRPTQRLPSPPTPIRLVFPPETARFAPFYKWLHRGVRDLPVLGKRGSRADRPAACRGRIRDPGRHHGIRLGAAGGRAAQPGPLGFGQRLPPGPRPCGAVEDRGPAAETAFEGIETDARLRILDPR